MNNFAERCLQWMAYMTACSACRKWVHFNSQRLAHLSSSTHTYPINHN